MAWNQGRTSAHLMEHEWQLSPASPAPLEKGALACRAGDARDSNQDSAPFCWAHAPFTEQLMCHQAEKDLRCCSSAGTYQDKGCWGDSFHTLQAPGTWSSSPACRNATTLGVLQTKIQTESRHTSGPLLVEGQTHFISVLEICQRQNYAGTAFF